MGDKTDHGPTTGFFPVPMAGGNDSIGTVTWPNGLIMKWGSLNLAAAANTTVTFATAFPNACFQAIACYGSGPLANETLDAHTIAAASFVIYSSCGSIQTGRWFAIGR